VKKEFKNLLSNAARPFLLGRRRNLLEVELLLVSNLNMEAYNKMPIQRFRESSSQLTIDKDALLDDIDHEDRHLDLIYLYFYDPL
jgi:hypothetical protein